MRWSCDTWIVAADALADLLDRAHLLEEEMDKLIVSSDSDLWAQQQADWAWFRFSSITCSLETKVEVALHALARGLLEQAAYWDWALGDWRRRGPPPTMGCYRV